MATRSTHPNARSKSKSAPPPKSAAAPATRAKRAREVQFVVTFSGIPASSGNTERRTTVHQMEGGGTERTWSGIHADKAGAWMKQHLGELESLAEPVASRKHGTGAAKRAPASPPVQSVVAALRSSAALPERAMRDRILVRPGRTEGWDRMVFALSELQIRVIKRVIVPAVCSGFPKVTDGLGRTRLAQDETGEKLDLEVRFEIQADYAETVGADLAVKVSLFARHAGNSDLSHLGEAAAVPERPGAVQWRSLLSDIQVSRVPCRLVAVVTSTKGRIRPAWIEMQLA